MNSKILVINSGSSSLKYTVYDLSENEICYGICERIFIDGIFQFKSKLRNEKEEYKISFPNHDAAIDHLMEVLKNKKIIDNQENLLAVGHRVVQGGNIYSESVLINEEVERNIEILSSLAPLHNKPELDVIRILRKKFPKVQNVAVFDTSFHTTMNELATTYAIPKKWREDYAIKRYGAHGTSFRYITNKFNLIEKRISSNLIICHLGNGASICAVKNNKSIHTSMGLTPLAGLIMGTRCGDIDPSIHKYVAKIGNCTIEDIDQVLHKESGLLGLSGSSDFRDLLEKRNSNQLEAILAFDLFVQKIIEYIVTYTNLLENKVDGIIFTAGIGENTPILLEEIFKKIFIKEHKVNINKNNESYDDFIKISEPNTPLIYKIRTNEELMIAIDVKKIVNKK